MGDGVNVAARLEGICEPGGICLSEDAYRQVKSRLELQVADLGPQSLKNIAEPVRAYLLRQGAPATPKPPQPAPRTRGVWARWPALAAALALVLLAAGAFAWRAGYAPRFMAASVDDKLANAPRLSIVVLPFENLSGDKEQDYFADGITDDLTTDLSHLPDSFVISRSTAFTYKGKPVDAKQIGRELGVRYLLEGSVRRLGEKVEVNAQLISTETGAHVWADRFEGDRSKLGELQVGVVSRLANSLGVELVKAEALRSMRERPNNPDAADLAMRARARFNSSGDSKSINSDIIDLSERALALDPQNERAMVDLVFAFNDRVTNRWDDDPAGDIVRAEKLADSALALQPDDARAHLAKAEVFFNKQQWRAAISQAEAALADDPNYADAHANLSFWNLFLGHSEDAFAGIETALRLSPRDPDVSLWQFFIATSTPISPNGSRRSNGAASRSRAAVRSRTCSSTSPPPTPGPAMTRRRRTPSLSCRKSIPASPCRPGPGCTGATIRPSTRNISASPKDCARRACRRVKRRRIEPARPCPVRVSEAEGYSKQKVRLDPGAPVRCAIITPWPFRPRAPWLGCLSPPPRHRADSPVSC